MTTTQQAKKKAMKAAVHAYRTHSFGECDRVALSMALDAAMPHMLVPEKERIVEVLKARADDYAARAEGPGGFFPEYYGKSASLREAIALITKEES